MQFLSFLCGITIAISRINAAEISEVVTLLHDNVQEIVARTQEFSEKGYTDEADGLARKTTNQLLKPSADRIATPAEIAAMVGAHLKTELYYAFNTQWGSGRIRDHRIVYDFLSQLDKTEARNANQKEHLTTFTILSLAAQEYFWNEKSTVHDLRDRVRRELRYGLFTQTGHKLDISSITYLDDTNVDRIINSWVNDSLADQLKILMGGFRAKSLGATYTAISNHLEATLKSVNNTALPLDLATENVSPYGLSISLELKPLVSLGDGMCGEYTLFIPTDGGPEGIQESNGRYKIYRAISDHATDPVTRRLYLAASKYMDGPNFIDLIKKQITELRLAESVHADAVQERLNAYEKFIIDKQNENDIRIVELKRTLLTKVMHLPNLGTSLATFKAKLSTPEQLAVCVTDRNFRTIIDEVMQLRTANAELDRLLTIIDADILRLDAEISEEASAQKLAAQTARTEAEKSLQLAQEDFQKFQITNAELVKEHKALFMTQQQLAKQLERAVEGSNTIPILQTGLERVNAQFSEFEKTHPEFINEIREKDTAIRSMYASYRAIVENTTSKDAILAKKYTLISSTLKDFINESILPGTEASINAISIEALCSRGYSNFVNGVCQGICTFIGDIETATASRGLWDYFDTEKDLLSTQMEQLLRSQRLEITTLLPTVPAELAPNSLKAEMSELALREGELDGWLPCDALYTQLWAIINNLNVFVFSGGEAGIRPKLDLMMRHKDLPYEQTATLYSAGTTGKHLATVMLTSPTARNVFLDKEPGHYNKFITPDDYAAIAKEIRHVAWANTGGSRYETYPK